MADCDEGWGEGDRGDGGDRGDREAGGDGGDGGDGGNGKSVVGAGFTANVCFAP
ncbi:hypothetical protein [Coleofasciculus sp. G2-EDA-02]|uniref:hypothetical protein n=1 Tax=Coleofasciculus sp. G2-EDA-02 TaxID=3069529 RepID=UPI0032F29F50